MRGCDIAALVDREQHFVDAVHLQAVDAAAHEGPKARIRNASNKVL